MTVPATPIATAVEIFGRLIAGGSPLAPGESAEDLFGMFVASASTEEWLALLDDAIGCVENEIARLEEWVVA